MTNATGTSFGSRFSRVVLGLSILVGTATASAGVITGTVPGNPLAGGSRWDYAPREMTIFGNVRNRSLADGLSYNMQGGSYQAYRDLFTWSGPAPEVGDFQQAVESAFNAWASIDPVSGFGTKLAFRFDTSVSVVGISTGNGTLNTDGAEIDLFGSSLSSVWGGTGRGIRGITSVGEVITPVTLTSGVVNYAGSRAIAGADIILNSQTSAVYTLDVFRRLLTHEIGHALGFGDVDVGTVTFIDNNFDIANPAATLSDSWAALVDPLNPAASTGLRAYTISGSVFSTTGVNLLMESNGLGVSAANPLSNLVPLSNDEYGIRQFLYPEIAPVPEPHAYALLIAGLLLVSMRRHARQGARSAVAF